MNKHMTMTVAALTAGWTAAALADGDAFELVPLAPEDPGWRISAVIRTAPKLKTKADIDGSAAVSRVGRVKPAVIGNPSAKAGSRTETTVSETTEDGGTETSGTTKDAARNASGYKAGQVRYDFENGYIDLDDAAGVAGETTNWHFDDSSAFDGTALSVSGTKNYKETKKNKKTKKTTTVSTTTRTTVAGGDGHPAVRETFAENPADSSEERADGLEIQIGRLVYEDGPFGVEMNAGYAFYRDVDCFKAGGRVYTGAASASRGTVETTTTTTKRTDTTETTTTTTESGSFATVVSQPEFTDLSDIQNPDGSIGGASYSGLPVQPGWGTPVLVVSSGRFSLEDRPGETTTSIESTTTPGTPETATATSRFPGASVSRTRTVDVHSKGELSLQELRLGASPFWKVADWLRVKADVGVLGTYAEVEMRTTVFADGSPVSSTRQDDDNWKVQGYAGLSLSVLPVDWLEIDIGAEARFPNRRIRFDDGIVSGSTELAKWDAFVAVGIRF